jgi:hypothetical protein
MAVLLKSDTHLGRIAKTIANKEKKDWFETFVQKKTQDTQRILLMGLAGALWYFALPQQPIVGLALLAITMYMPLSVDNSKGQDMAARRAEKEEHQRYLKGHYGEILVNKKLQDLPDSYYIIADLNLGRGRQIDHVVVGPPGIITLETKHISGTFHPSPDPSLWYKQWGRQLVPAKNPVKQALDSAQHLAKLIGQQVYTAVVFTHHPINVKYLGPQDHNCSIIYLHQLLPMIKNMRQDKLTPEQVRELTHKILELNQDTEGGSREPSLVE